MRAKVSRWGNSSAVRLPASLLSALGLGVDDAVDIREEHGRIVIEPVRSEADDLDALLARITPDNVHEEVDFGPAVGDEAL